MSGLVSMVIAVLNVNHGVPIGWAILVGLVIGAVAGLVNGLIVIGLNADPFIVTLGTGTVFTGIVYWLSGEATITGVWSGLS
jgi:ribose transport system permease protein